MLVGSFEHTLDSKGRVSLPSSFRKELDGSDLILVPSPTDKALLVFNPENFDAWMKSLFERNGGFNPRSKKDLIIRQRILGSSASAVIDAAGRVNVPAKLRAYADLEKDVVVLGNQDYIELWDAQSFEEAMSEISDEEFADFFFDE